MGPDPGPLEGGAEDQAAVVGHGEDGGPSRLLDLDHLSLDHDLLAHHLCQFGGPVERQLFFHLHSVVLLQLRRLQLDVAVGQDVSHRHK